MTSFERHPTVTIGRSYFDTLVRRYDSSALRFALRFQLPGNRNPCHPSLVIFLAVAPLLNVSIFTRTSFRINFHDHRILS